MLRAVADHGTDLDALLHEIALQAAELTNAGAGAVFLGALTALSTCTAADPAASAGSSPDRETSVAVLDDVLDLE